jgi:homopolymeric O-antigen transport system ATP-binding protein
MSSNSRALAVHGLSKTYRIPIAIHRHTLISEVLVERLRHPLRRTPKEEFHALTDVNVEIAPGEAVGIIGRNGAGKSTLLKILSRIVGPTEGRVELYGQVGSLLEVGTGFHPELTGRENVFLNGAILGMKRDEIVRNFESIVSFAEIGQFLDTPVKRYSSGMYVRLAFAVAAHLTPDILLVDEVLAVGDAGFQKKCLGKMGEVTGTEGRTVMFVSHNMTAIQSFCPRTVYLEGGRVAFDGDTRQAIDQYFSTSARGEHEETGVFDLTSTARTANVEDPMLQRVELRGADGDATDVVRMGEGLSISVDVAGLVRRRHRLRVQVLSATDQPILVLLTSDLDTGVDEPSAEQERLTLHIPRLPLVTGTYWVAVSVHETMRSKVMLDEVEHAASFEVLPADVFGNGQRVPHRALVFVDAHWEIESLTTGAQPRGQ